MASAKAGTTASTTSRSGSPHPPPLDGRGSFLLSQLGYHVAERCAELLAPMGLQPAHFGVLTKLVDAEGLSQQQLADTLHLHRNVMVGLIDELEDRGLVRRDRDPQDRRAHQIRLTAHAHAVLADANAALDDLERELFAELTPAEHADLIELLRRTATHAALPEGIHPGLSRRRTGKPTNEA